MRNIPDDIMKAAEEAFYKWQTASGPGGIVVEIAKAILAERQRCASLAHSWAATCKRVGQIEGEGVAEDIAMVIEDGIPAELEGNSP